MCKWLYSGGALVAATALALSAAQHLEAATSMTGCLVKAEKGFVLNTSEKPLLLTGDLDFVKHNGHTVKVTGEKLGSSLRVTSLEHVSPTCEGSVSSSSKTDQYPTASDQGTSESDIETTAKIRRAIVADDNLSVAAHNITIVTRDGKITLRGEVPSMQEKSAVVAKAEAAVGVPVDNQLTVKDGSDKSIQERR